MPDVEPDLQLKAHFTVVVLLTGGLVRAFRTPLYGQLSSFRRGARLTAGIA